MAARKNTPKNNDTTIDPDAQYTVGEIATMLAERRGKSVSDASKDVRRRLRANFDRVVALDPNVSNVKTAANDGNRWPAMNGRVAALVLSPRAMKDADA